MSNVLNNLYEFLGMSNWTITSLGDLIPLSVKLFICLAVIYFAFNMIYKIVANITRF